MKEEQKKRVNEWALQEGEREREREGERKGRMKSKERDGLTKKKAEMEGESESAKEGRLCRIKNKAITKPTSRLSLSFILIAKSLFDPSISVPMSTASFYCFPARSVFCFVSSLACLLDCREHDALLLQTLDQICLGKGKRRGQHTIGHLVLLEQQGVAGLDNHLGRSNIALDANKGCGRYVRDMLNGQGKNNSTMAL